MLEATVRHLRHDKRGVSNVIVVVLSLVLVVIIVGNIVLWSYQMNQLDWEKMQEKVTLENVNVNRSPWFTTQSEYTFNIGSCLSGTYTDTWVVDDQYESLKEEISPSCRLDIAGQFSLDTSTYPLAYVQSVEIQIRYRASDFSENWFLKAYNWTGGQYGDAGFNSTAGDTPATGFKYYTVNLTNAWQSYVQNGTMKIEFCDNMPDENQTSVDIDFLGVRLVLDGVSLSFRNDGPDTAHIVAIWVTDSTRHTRYSADFFLNSASSADYFVPSITIATSDFTVRAVTERGNIAVFGKS
jgi:hypothetical protein